MSGLGQRPAPTRRGVRPSLRDVGLVAAGGAVGAVARVALAEAFAVDDGAYPWATFAENLIGAFTLAVVLTLLAERFVTDRRVQPLLCTGALGAFTTYSTFATELGGRLLDGHLLVAAAYAATSVVGGLAAAVLGVRATRAWPWIPGRRAQDPQRRGRP